MVSENEKLILSIFHPFSSRLSDIPMTILRFIRERLDPDRMCSIRQRLAAPQRPAGRHCESASRYDASLPTGGRYRATIPTPESGNYHYLSKSKPQSEPGSNMYAESQPILLLCRRSAFC